SCPSSPSHFRLHLPSSRVVPIPSPRGAPPPRPLPRTPAFVAPISSLRAIPPSLPLAPLHRRRSGMAAGAGWLTGGAEYETEVGAEEQHGMGNDRQSQGT
ncbi:unnamed protein product, partial [Urochloa humidicola]